MRLPWKSGDLCLWGWSYGQDSTHRIVHFMYCSLCIFCGGKGDQPTSLGTPIWQLYMLICYEIKCGACKYHIQSLQFHKGEPLGVFFVECFNINGIFSRHSNAIGQSSKSMTWLLVRIHLHKNCFCDITALAKMRLKVLHSKCKSACFISCWSHDCFWWTVECNSQFTQALQSAHSWPNGLGLKDVPWVHRGPKNHLSWSGPSKIIDKNGADTGCPRGPHSIFLACDTPGACRAIRATTLFRPTLFQLKIFTILTNENYASIKLHEVRRHSACCLRSTEGISRCNSQT